MSSKKANLAQEVARAVSAGKKVKLETVDFSDPLRHKTCLEVDFPILPINQLAIIEGNAGKPIYQMSKWWARRRSSVFRSLLLSAATRAPDDPSQAAKTIWESYYGDHQKSRAFENIKVADIFMGGGTTLVEGSRLGMQMHGNDLNPVAWSVVKQEMSKASIKDVKRLLAEVEAELRPQLAPFVCCDGPNGEKGTWVHLASGRIEKYDFDPLALTQEQRKEYSYSGPETIYTFWSKHAPCQVTGCGHRTPIMSSPIIGTKTLTVQAWKVECEDCKTLFDVEASSPRMAPGVALVVSEDEAPYAVIERSGEVKCPICTQTQSPRLGTSRKKKVGLSLLAHPTWLAGSPKVDSSGESYGGSAGDGLEETRLWNVARAKTLDLVEYRGSLPDEIHLSSDLVLSTTNGTVPKTGHFQCEACGIVQRIVVALEATNKSSPVSVVSIQGYSKALNASGNPYGGRFFAPLKDTRQLDAAAAEWDRRKDADLAEYWPRSAIPFGHMTHQRQPLPQHGYLSWSDMFNPRQMLIHAQLLKAVMTIGDYNDEVRDFALGAFQQYLRNQNMFCFWNLTADKMEPLFSNNNYHPKSLVIENSVFGQIGRGNWISCTEGIIEGREWAEDPWEPVSKEGLNALRPDLAAKITGTSEKVRPGDKVLSAVVSQGSSTSLPSLESGSFDLVITDPPFGGLLHYSELSDFFYVWLRLAFKNKFPKEFGPEYVPKATEAVSNRARQPEDPDGFYQRVLTECWREAHRILKVSGLLAFTFHHSEDEPWIAVLESLFEAGFYLEATYPIRSDETKGEGEFGSKKIEYDIIHVCRKRTEEPRPVSWARMRREVITDIRHLEANLANHAKAGLPAADLQVIRRGKALEYFSRHYGKVLIEEDKVLTVAEALIGINQLIDEETDAVADVAPTNAEPLTRQFLRIFRGRSSVDRDQIQKYLKGTGVGPDEFEVRGWSTNRAKQFHIVDALEFATAWKGRQRRNLISDYDQAWFLVGACHEGSGINAAEQLRNDNFKPHPALKPLLEWLSRNGADVPTKRAASRAVTIYNGWAEAHRDVVSRQLELFG